MLAEPPTGQERGSHEPRGGQRRHNERQTIQPRLRAGTHGVSAPARHGSNYPGNHEARQGESRAEAEKVFERFDNHARPCLRRFSRIIASSRSSAAESSPTRSTNAESAGAPKSPRSAPRTSSAIPRSNSSRLRRGA